MKFIILTILIILLTGCKDKVEKVYVDANGTEIVKYKTIKLDYVCDERGYKYYRQHTYMFDIYLPLYLKTLV